MVSDGKEGHVQLIIAGISMMDMEWNNDGFDVPCGGCEAENTIVRLSGDLPEGIAGHYCDSCYRQVCAKVLEHFQKLFEESARSLKTTLVSRKDAKWSPGEIATITASVGEEVWMSPEHPEHLIVPGHCAEGVFRALKCTLKYSVQNMVGTEKLPFVPLL